MSPSPRITTADVPSDARLDLKPGEMAIESIAHACFRLHSAAGSRVLIDPYASGVWLGYDFPEELATDAILITHPHFDHDGGEFIGRKVPWTPEVRVLRDPGRHTVDDFRITGIRGKHADPWGREFGQKNTIWRVEVNGLRILKHHEVQAIRRTARPRVLIPMHYRHPDLERSEDNPHGLGPIEPWLAGKKRVTRLKSNYALFTTGSLKSGERIVVFQHSPKVRA